ncbi:DUF86 domain-containing protein [candidate division KSB1 bacterium]|nr:DUF86 domain-containing protein [candidate division KSB1 bacterium]
MSISPLEFLRHILDETNYLIKHSEGMSKEDFSYNDTLKRAFVRSLEIIGEAAKKIGCKIVSFSSGGKMEEFCIKNNINFKKIPEIHSPRASFTVFLYSMLKVLEPVIPLAKNGIEESISQLKNLKNEISSSFLSEENPSLNLANWIRGIPLIFYPWGLQAAAIRFKNSLNENAKMHALAEDMIEACHNEIVAWEVPPNIQPILLQGKDDFVKTKERWKILKEFFNSNDIEYKEVFSASGDILTKLINLIYFFDFTSIYRAVLSEIDPSPIKSINFIKKRL